MNKKNISLTFMYGATAPSSQGTAINQDWQTKLTLFANQARPDGTHICIPTVDEDRDHVLHVTIEADSPGNLVRAYDGLPPRPPGLGLKLKKITGRHHYEGDHIRGLETFLTRFREIPREVEPDRRPVGCSAKGG